MTNLGAGFSVDSSESAGPTPPSSSGPPSERDRYVAAYCASHRRSLGSAAKLHPCLLQQAANAAAFVACERSKTQN